MFELMWKIGKSQIRINLLSKLDNASPSVPAEAGGPISKIIYSIFFSLKVVAASSHPVSFSVIKTPLPPRFLQYAQ